MQAFCAGLQLTTEETTDTPESRHEQAQLVLAVHVMVEQLQHAPQQPRLQPAGPESCRWTWLWLPWGLKGPARLRPAALMAHSCLHDEVRITGLMLPPGWSQAICL